TQVRVRLDGHGQRPHQGGVLFHGAVVLARDDRVQVAPQGTGVDVRDAARLLGPHRLHHQLRLAAPLAVERGLAGPGAGGHGVHGEGVVADLAEQVEHGRVQLGLAFGRDPAATWGRRLRHPVHLSVPAHRANDTVSYTGRRYPGP